MTAKNVYAATASTSTTAITTTGAIADGNFTVASTNATITEINNSGNWPNHIVTVTCTPAVAPSADGGLNLYLVETEVDGTNDETMPALADDNGARYVGRVSLDDVASAQYSNLIIPTIGIRKFQLAFENDCGQSVNSGATVKVEGCSLEDV